MVENGAGSLYDLDRTSIETLLPYFFHLADRAQRANTSPSGARSATVETKMYADQAAWL